MTRRELTLMTIKIFHPVLGPVLQYLLSHNMYVSSIFFYSSEKIVLSSSSTLLKSRALLLTPKMYRYDVQQVLYSLRTLYLFTVDDFVSIVLPNTSSGLTLPLANGLLQRPATIRDVMPRAPLVLLWVWANLLLFNMSNQSQPGAILEDATNKPWRPIASGRVTVQSVQYYIGAVRFGLFGMSLVLGGTCPSLFLQLLTFWYNDLGGGEEWLLRNFLNAGGYLCFTIGAMQVARGSQHFDLSNVGLKWLGWTSVIIACTMHVQDLYDQKGDKLRDRRTIPLVFGNTIARYSIAIPVVFWSFAAPAFWRLSIFGFLPSVTLGITISMRLLRNGKGNVAYDKVTFVYWNAWLISIHMLPVLAQLFEYDS